MELPKRGVTPPPKPLRIARELAAGVPALSAS
jgi:hypothetical protein